MRGDDLQFSERQQILIDRSHGRGQGAGNRSRGVVERRLPEVLPRRTARVRWIDRKAGDIRTRRTGRAISTEGNPSCGDQVPSIAAALNRHLEPRLGPGRDLYSGCALEPTRGVRQTPGSSRLEQQQDSAGRRTASGPTQVAGKGSPPPASNDRRFPRQRARAPAGEPCSYTGREDWSAWIRNTRPRSHSFAGSLWYLACQNMLIAISGNNAG